MVNLSLAFNQGCVMNSTEIISQCISLVPKYVDYNFYVLYSYILVMGITMMVSYFFGDKEEVKKHINYVFFVEGLLFVILATYQLFVRLI